MIEGFKIDVSSNEMKAIFEKRAASHRKQAGECEDKAREVADYIKSMAPVPAARMPKLPAGLARRFPGGLVGGYGGGSLKGMMAGSDAIEDGTADMIAQEAAAHKAMADRYDFLAAHVIPNEVYRIRMAELDMVASQGGGYMMQRPSVIGMDDEFGLA